MIRPQFAAFCSGAALTSVIVLGIGAAARPAQDAPAPPAAMDPAAIAEMMKKAEALTAPGPKHEFLKKFVGRWDVSTHLTMGGQKTPGEAGTAEFSWLVEGRWLQSQMRGTMMGRPLESFQWLGYDNFKQSYVSVSVSSMDTAMNTAEGDVDPFTGALITYGTLDEYLTGEHDKMVRNVWRFDGDDRIVVEVHDLAIGENHTQVIEMVFTRKT